MDTLFLRIADDRPAVPVVFRDYIVQKAEIDGAYRISVRYPAPAGKARSKWEETYILPESQFQADLDSLTSEILGVGIVSVAATSDCPQMSLGTQPDRVTQTRANSALRFTLEKHIADAQA